jgi:hypothetical protein
MQYRIIIILLLIIPFFTEAQRWKRNRYELSYGIAYANFFGDIGGGSSKGGQSILSIKDIDFGSSRPGFVVGARYKAAERVAIKLNFIYGYVAADDKYSGFPGRRDRGISFSSYLFEQSLVGEFSIVKERFGRRYTLGNIKSFKKLKINTYLFGGVAGFAFNPKTKYVNDSTGVVVSGHEQHPFSKGEKYSKYQLALPLGIGFKYGINRKLSFNVEYGTRFTFTDYIDNHNDRHKMNKSNDSYMFLTFCFIYKLRTTRSGLPKF